MQKSMSLKYEPASEGAGVERSAVRIGPPSLGLGRRVRLHIPERGQVCPFPRLRRAQRENLY